jgi:hypothetical protein
MVPSLTPNYKCIYVKSKINKTPSLSWKYRNQCTFGIRSYISYFRKEAAATIPVAKQKKISYVGLFFIASVCKRNTLSLFCSSAVSSWDDLLITRSSFIQNSLRAVAHFRLLDRYRQFEGTLSMFSHDHISKEPSVSIGTWYILEEQSVVIFTRPHFLQLAYIIENISSP